ncbi:MAG: GNAT family N-acetyltransferase [Eubacterium sp.]|nr:GNAT family N-acetyltransferase [Eubacterium sp.]
MEIKLVSDDAGISDFINEEFSDYATDCEVALNYEEFCYAAEEDGKILGVITGRAYYNEVHIGDLIVSKECRRVGVGRKLVAAVEKDFSGKGFIKIALTTFGFQAPEFYKKLGYELEFVREDRDPKLNKYFYLKNIKGGSYVH